MSVTGANRSTKSGGELALSPPDQRLLFGRLLQRHCIEPLAQTAAAIALGGTGGCVPSGIRANTAIILGGTGGCVPSKNAALGGTGGCVPSSIAANLLWDDKLPGARLAAMPRITNTKTTALAVGFIAISSFLGSGAVKRAATVQGRPDSSVAWREMLGMQSRNCGNTRIR